MASMAGLFRRRGVTGSVVLGSYTLLTLLLFMPVLSQFTTAILIGSASGEQDGWQNVWNLWWVQYAIQHGQNPYLTTMLFYPTGVGLFWQTLDLPHGMLALPIAALVNPIAAYNSVALLSFVASSYTMYLLAWRMTDDSFAAWIAGCLFAFAPFHLTKLFDGQLELLCVQYVPLFILSLWVAFERQRWPAVACSALLLVVLALTSLYYGLFSLIYLGMFGLLSILRRRDRDTLRRVSVQGVLICTPLALILAPGLIGTATGAGLDDWLQRQMLHSATPLDFALPNPYSPLWGTSVLRFQSALHPGIGGFVISSGLVALVLASVSLIRWRHVWVWVALAMVMGLFSLGPYLVLGGVDTHLPLPFLLLDLLPGVRFGQRPNQIAVFSSALLALLAAYGWVELTRWLPGRWRALAIGVLLVILAVDLWPAGLTQSALKVNTFYTTLPPADHGAILELPYQPDRSDYIGAQLIHQRPILGGYLARVPAYPFAEETEGIRQFWQPKLPRDSILYADWTQALTPTLAAYDIEYVVVHRTASPRVSEALQSVLAAQLEEVYRDAALVAYRRPTSAPVRPLVNLRGPGWYPLERRDPLRWQWTDHQMELALTNPTGRPMVVTLQFRAAAFQTVRDVTLYQLMADDAHRLGTWAVPRSPDARSYRIFLTLAPGDTQLRVVVHGDRATDATGRTLGLMFTRLALVPVDLQNRAQRERGAGLHQHLRDGNADTADAPQTAADRDKNLRHLRAMSRR